MEKDFLVRLLLLVIGVSNTEGCSKKPVMTPGEECLRTCQPNDARICYFNFVLENYQAMGVACKNCSNGIEADCYHPQCIIGDGIGKSVMSINRQIPGPSIQICKNDVLVVDVENRIHGSATTIHWHGLTMRKAPFMDGVPFVTQCPIHNGNIFRYQFKIPEFGTYFYHSHSGFHRTNGIHGSIIIRQPISENAHSSAYDFDLPEHHLLIADYLHSLAEEIFPAYPYAHPQSPDSITINGIGSYINPLTAERESIPPCKIYFVTPGKRYRFRLMDAASFTCPVMVQIYNHRLTVIAADGWDVEPHDYDSIVLNSGERYDFVLTADQDPGDYWIRVRGLAGCEDLTLTESFALLRYLTQNESDRNATRPPMPPYGPYQFGEVLNYPNVTCKSSTDHCVTELRSLQEDTDLRNSTPDYKFYLAFSNYFLDKYYVFDQGKYPTFRNPNVTDIDISAISDITFDFPTSPPLTQPEDVDESTYCDNDSKPDRCAAVKYCPCVHRIYIETNSTVELVLVDEKQTLRIVHHPFHLHGYHFQLIDIGQSSSGIPLTVDLAKELDAKGELSNEPNPNPPFKDTASIPNAGYARIRFRADNPGYWFFHCHIEWHTAMGFDLIFQVGQNSEMKKAPVEFPRCGNYVPKLYMQYD